MKKYILIIILLLISILTYGQVFTPEVVASSGDQGESQGYLLSWTLGETITETFLFDSEQITQGFHQPEMYQITFLTGNLITDQYTIKVYPNPARSYFFVEVNSEEIKRPLTISLYDILGTNVEELVLDPGSGKKKINISQYPSDMFILSIIDEHGILVQKYKVIKVKM